jgi:hypothetical protein
MRREESTGLTPLASEIWRRLRLERGLQTSELQPHFAGSSREEVRIACEELVNRGYAEVHTEQGEPASYSRIRGALIED